MSDLISRDDAIDSLKECKTEVEDRWDAGYNAGIESAIADIRELLSAQQWIPTTDCLPTEDDLDYYWVTMNDKVELAWCIDPKNNKWSVYDPEGLPYDSYDIVAWLPKPEPYKEVQG